ncbi:MAG TPA: transglycosylase SLT domain-containing protein [Thermoanaerobaculia bacterium]|nr:transglycosylase SLT domain-containing protein [Thermoanaerobaculia bacterium]
MSTSRRTRRLRARSILALVAVGAITGGPLPGGESPRPAAPVAETAVPGLERTLGELGALVRGQEWRGSRAALETLATRPDDPRAPLARVLLGLLAHAHDDPALAARLLAEGEAPDLLEDWRLYILADAAAAGRDLATARAALDRLIAAFPDSPLRAPALVELTRAAWEAGDVDAALAGIARARRSELEGEAAIELEQLAWTVAVARGDATAMRESARRLLVMAPLEASKMRLVDAVARRGGGSDWRLWLSEEELVARSAALLAADVPAGALTTLDAVAAAGRGVEWHRLRALALIDSARGVDAYRALEPVAAGSETERTELAWTRALAAGSGGAGPGLDATVRAHWRRIEREWLLATARSAGDPGLRARSLARLAASYLRERRLDETLAALRELADVDPEDRQLARPLWEAGWEAYTGARLHEATEIWAALETLYPRSPWARSGSYWTARALDTLGEREAARARYLAILGVEVSDFYARQAALRLVGAQATAAAAPAPEPWPEDAALRRARLLSDLGLDGLATTELALLGERADPRARAALSGLVLARSGDRRASLRELKRAFPDLGTSLQGSAPTLALDLYYPLDFRATIEHVAALERLPPSLVFGMVHQESGFDPTARSRSGARGLMQLMPATGREVASRLGLPFSYARLEQPDYSVRLGAHYYRRMLDQFDGNVELALAAYNGGPGRISRWWRAEGSRAELDRFLEGLALEESRHYVKRIVVLAESYRSRHPDLG